MGGNKDWLLEYFKVHIFRQMQEPVLHIRNKINDFLQGKRKTTEFILDVYIIYVYIFVVC